MNELSLSSSPGFVRYGGITPYIAVVFFSKPLEPPLSRPESPERPVPGRNRMGVVFCLILPTRVQYDVTPRRSRRTSNPSLETSSNTSLSWSPPFSGPGSGCARPDTASEIRATRASNDLYFMFTLVNNGLEKKVSHPRQEAELAALARDRSKPGWLLQLTRSHIMGKL